MPPDPSAIDNALVTKLASDTALLALMPNGVAWDEAPANSTKFVIVSLLSALDEPKLGGRAREENVYLVKAVSRDPNANMQGAAKRIDELLEGQPLTIVGYSLMVLRRVERVRFTEVDEVDRAIRWYHRGGHYELVAAVT